MALLLAFTVFGCGISDLEFTNDTRLSFLAPGERELVGLPVTIEWTMEDFAATGLDGSSKSDRGAFVVFVDQAPIPAGRDLAWIARGDSSCSRDARCPDVAYLADRGVYVTTETSITLEQLPRVGGPNSRDEEHYVNVVLVDGTGARIGESAWYRTFLTPRRSS